MWVPEQHKNEPRMKNDLDKFNLGTWNMRLLYAAGALIVLKSNFERYRLAITAIQEFRWTGEGNFKSKECTFIFTVVGNF